MIGTTPVLIHAPHGSKEIPDLARGSLIIGDAEIESELLAMTDLHTDTLADNLNAKNTDKVPFAFINRVSRLAVDPERFLDDREEMLSVGMGAVYTHGSRGQEIRQDNDILRTRLVEKYFEPYEKSLAFFTKNILAIHQRVAIIDLHSYAADPLPYEMNQSMGRPGICLGTDSFHTPEWMLNQAKDIFETADYSVAVNSPFTGTYVPAEFYGKDDSVISIMVEINRSLYMDEKTGKLREDGFLAIRTALEQLATALALPRPE